MSEVEIKPDGTKITHFNTSDPQSMLKAKEMAERILQKQGVIQESSQSQAQENEDIEQIKTDRDAYKNLLDLVATKEFERKKAQIHCDDPNITTPDQLLAWNNGKKSATVKPIPSGTVPLSSQTPANQNQGFGSVEEMIDDCNKPENKDVRNALLHKVLKGVVEGKLSLKSYEAPPVETTSSDLSPDLKLSKNPDVLGIQAMYRRKKLLERAKRTQILDSGSV